MLFSCEIGFISLFCGVSRVASGFKTCCLVVRVLKVGFGIVKLVYSYPTIGFDSCLLSICF